MFISNVFRKYDDINAGDQLLFTMKTSLQADLETEFQYSRSDISSQAVSKDWYYMTWPLEEPINSEINHFRHIVGLDSDFEIIK